MTTTADWTPTSFNRTFPAPTEGAPCATATVERSYCAWAWAFTTPAGTQRGHSATQARAIAACDEKQAAYVAEAQ